MFEDIDKILIDTETIAGRVEELASEIVREITPSLSKGESLMIVPVLTGSLVFVADLVRKMPQKVRIDVVMVSSYPGTATESSGAQIVGDLPADLSGRHVLIVDDIFDTGRTIAVLREQLGALAPASLQTCVLLRKPDRVIVDEQPEYIGFDIPDEFVVGYGLDFDGHYRNLPYIGTLHRHAIEGNESGEEHSE